MAELGDLSARVKNGRLSVGGKVGSGDVKITVPGRPAGTAWLSMRSRRRALILTTDTYEDPRLRKVAPSPAGVGALARVLRDPEMGKFEPVAVVRNQAAASAADEAERFLADGSDNEALLVYVHGVVVQAGDGRLFLATSDTSLTATEKASIELAWLEDRLGQKARRRCVVILDCRYTARFGREGGPRAGDEVPVDRYFPSSSGRAVLTASPVLEAPPRAATTPDAGRGLIGPVITGLRGKADGDGDGVVTVEELFAHVCGAVADEAPTDIPVVVDPGPRRRLAVSYGVRVVDKEGGVKAPKPGEPRERPTEGASPGAAPSGSDAGAHGWPPANEPTAPGAGWVPPPRAPAPSPGDGARVLRSTAPWWRQRGWLPWAIGGTVAAVAVSVPLAVGLDGSEPPVPVVTSPPITTPVVTGPPLTSPPTTFLPSTPRPTTAPPGPPPTAPPPVAPTLSPPPPPPTFAPFQSPRLSLSKTSGPPGTTLTVTGSGYAPNELVRIRFHTETVGFTNADATGAFADAPIQIPPSWRFTGQYDVIATGEDSIRSTSRPFEVTAA